MERSQNGDLWGPIFDEKAKIHGGLEVNRTPAHARLEGIALGRIPTLDFLGNFVADRAAAAAAERAAAAVPDASSTCAWIERTLRVAARLAKIEALHWEAGPNLVPQPVLTRDASLPTDALREGEVEGLRRHGHALRWRRGRSFCMACRRSFPKNGLGKWAITLCTNRRGYAEALSPPTPSTAPVATCIQEAAYRTGAKRSRPTIRDDPDAEPVPSAKRRAMTVDKYAEAEQIRQREQLEVRAIQLDLLRSHPHWHTLRALPRGHAALPFPADPTHVIIMRGGYFGCLACGHVAGYKAVAAFGKRCRLYTPPGSRGAVDRLLAGALPHAHHSRPDIAAEWPTGEATPPLQWLGRGHIHDRDL